MKCSNCGSTNFEFSKWITWGEVCGKGFHYRCKCLNCRRSYGIERNRENFELVKDLKWKISKVTIKHLKKCGKTVKDLY